MRYVIVRRSHVDTLQHRIRVLELEVARGKWLKHQHHALERSHGKALAWIRAHRCTASALSPAAQIPSYDDNVVEIRGREAVSPEVNRVSD